jgi:hypothetical protein
MRIYIDIMHMYMMYLSIKFYHQSLTLSIKKVDQFISILSRCINLLVL